MKKLAKQYLDKLQLHPYFSKIRLTLSQMSSTKKNSHWATVRLTGVVLENEIIEAEATIFLNFRDLTTKDLLIEALAEEGAHLVLSEDWEKIKLELIKYLKGELNEG